MCLFVSECDCGPCMHVGIALPFSVCENAHFSYVNNVSVSSVAMIHTSVRRMLDSERAERMEREGERERERARERCVQELIKDQ